MNKLGRFRYDHKGNCYLVPKEDLEEFDNIVNIIRSGWGDIPHVSSTEDYEKELYKFNKVYNIKMYDVILKDDNG